MKPKSYVKTTDIVLFTSLILLYPKIDYYIENDSLRATFCFVTSPQIDILMKKARMRTLKVEVYAFNSQLRMIKGMIKDHVGR